MPPAAQEIMPAVAVAEHQTFGVPKVVQESATLSHKIGSFYGAYIRDSMLCASSGVSRLLRRMTILEVDPDSLPRMQRPMCVGEVSGSSAFSVHMRTGEVVLSNFGFHVFPRIMCRVGSGIRSTESWVAERHRFTDCFFMRIDAGSHRYATMWSKASVTCFQHTTEPVAAANGYGRHASCCAGDHARRSRG
jgi:hypothetical protein